ncbi:LemA family protein [Cellulophaga sp. Z1A5H]|uniref:LemA family protein n=1 Tax=Cellulophaga sp. Z1A5H TaxID=2687291 RepID=UPI0013FE1051|nr:LemA family protein [Cellulophaga sp. Z1A5H]
MISTYNKIVKKKNNLDFSLKNIDVQLKKRFESLPNIAAVVKKYMSHEKELLTNITKIRSDYNDTEPISKNSATEKQISQWLGDVSLVLENYPDLKSIDAVVLLQRTINEHAEQISASERAYNASVVDYNTSITVFPNNIIAGIFKFKVADYLEIAIEKRDNPDMTSLL